MGINKIKMVVAGVIGLLGATNVYSIYKVRQITKAIDNISNDIDVDIPDRIVMQAVDKAADREAKMAAAQCKTVADETIHTEVKKEISNVKKDLSNSVSEEIQRQISLLDINDIKSKIVKDVGKSVAYDLFSPIQKRNETAEIIRACNDAGITGPYSVKQILETANR